MLPSVRDSSFRLAPLSIVVTVRSGVAPGVSMNCIALSRCQLSTVWRLTFLLAATTASILLAYVSRFTLVIFSCTFLGPLIRFSSFNYCMGVISSMGFFCLSNLSFSALLLYPLRSALYCFSFYSFFAFFARKDSTSDSETINLAICPSYFYICQFKDSKLHCSRFLKWFRLVLMTFASVSISVFSILLLFVRMSRIECEVLISDSKSLIWSLQYFVKSIFSS